MIPNGVNLKRFRPADGSEERQELRHALGIAKDDLVVATVGAVMPRKGHDLLLESWVGLAKRFPSAHLLIVGPRADLHDPKLADFGARLRELVERSGAPDRVHFVGMAENVEAYLRAADLFVLASQREGFPNSVLEAMATGLPAVLTRFIGFSERLGRADEQYRLADATPDALGTAIAGLLDDAELRRRLGRAAQRWVSENLDVERSLDRYASLYRELAHARAEAGGRAA
jgi:glycosyltransferase involved in cell wall biosynthesis